MMGVENFDAVINPPHASILAVGAGLSKPVVGAGGAIEVATVMSVTLSVDHRVIDGALGATFLKAVRQILSTRWDARLISQWLAEHGRSARSGLR